eukprot:CAMPEP_0195151890 /NCGR_PEP_ID=MMETSP0448-20130528/181397_1 /TAXON_ID=66468 /ORGANISM="Heterocapsa triquestra, Strain CCMP 448" /LENGTH=129 /DNA_ID=CAMNT_0040190621 /DNA_START=1 /DNA_END=387 /DNA_ORIENTATION=+
MFALTNRVEELVSDALNDRVQSQLAELAHRRSVDKGDLDVARRIGQCELTVQQAVGSLRGLEDAYLKMMQMNMCYSSMPTGAPVSPALSRSATSQSLGISSQLSFGRSLVAGYDEEGGLGFERERERER